MTPLQIRMALDFYSIPHVEIPPSDAHHESLTMLVSKGLLASNEGGGFLPTDALGVFVEALCAVPLPIKKWVMP